MSASSRTDSGVHAIAMPVSFNTESNLPLRAFMRGLNSILPEDLKVIRADEMPEGFHARFSAGPKMYEYRIQTGNVPLPLLRRSSWFVPQTLDVAAMAQAATLLIGQHDFSAFRSSQCDALSPIRTVDLAEVHAEGENLVLIRVKSKGFLRNMVRIIAGTLVDVGKGRHDPVWISELIESKDRTRGGVTAPAQGLFLVSVDYPGITPITKVSDS